MNFPWLKLFLTSISNTFKFNLGCESSNMCIVINMYWPEEDLPPPPCIQQIRDQDLGSLTFSEGGGGGVEGHRPAPVNPSRIRWMYYQAPWLITNRSYNKLLPQMTARVITFLICALYRPFHKSHRSHSPDLDRLSWTVLMEPLMSNDWFLKREFEPSFFFRAYYMFKVLIT